MSNNNQKEFLRKLKMEVATDMNLLGNIKENNDHYRGDKTSKENGSLGGPIGGEMVKRMVAYAKENA